MHGLGQAVTRKIPVFFRYIRLGAVLRKKQHRHGRRHEITSLVRRGRRTLEPRQKQMGILSKISKIQT